MTHPMPTLDLAPVRREIARQHVEHAELADRIGVERSSLRRWIANGCLTWGQADRLAVALGRHPSDLWGADWWAVEEAHAAARAASAARRRGRAWAGVERSWRQWRAQCERLEVHREAWA